MKYLIFCCHEERHYDTMPEGETNAMMDETLAYIEELRERGHYIASEPLQSVATATTVRMRNGKLSATDGPFAETKEQIAGFFLIDARDLNQAIQIASRFPAARAGSMEVRPVAEIKQPQTVGA